MLSHTVRCPRYDKTASDGEAVVLGIVEYLFIAIILRSTLTLSVITS